MVICTGQYSSFDMISFTIYVLLNRFNGDKEVLSNRFNGDKETLFLPEARHSFLIVATLHCFCLPVPQKSKIILRKYVSYLGTVESDLEHNVLI